jgi:hypothetical protein
MNAIAPTTIAAYALSIAPSSRNTEKAAKKNNPSNTLPIRFI